ncbi:MAG: acetylglutamate kinase [Candidatus Saganbacteria bacterium]|nr:acetylglutamate kinase [Candidatus Saganbacteria bacterium]
MYKHLIKRASIVIEALPYLLKFHGKVIVIKYGGSVLEDEELRQALLRDVVLLKYLGMHPVLVHGGGKDINKSLKRKGIEPKFIQGLRVTDKETMKVVAHVLGEKNNRTIARLIKKQGGKAISLYGKKGRVIRAHKIYLRGENGERIDLGCTGTVTGVRYRVLMKWIKKGYIPVISSIGVGKGGGLFNINADSAAASIAGYLKAAKLILLTDVKGVLDSKGELVSQVNTHKIWEMIKSGDIKGGMIPKVKCGLTALKKGTETVHIIDANIPHALLLELFTDHGIGTMVVK